MSDYKAPCPAAACGRDERPNVLNVPLHELGDRLDSLPSAPLWVHCAGGYHARTAASMLARCRGTTSCSPTTNTMLPRPRGWRSRPSSQASGRHRCLRSGGCGEHRLPYERGEQSAPVALRFWRVAVAGRQVACLHGHALADPRTDHGGLG